MTRWHNYYLDNHAHFVTATVADWRPLLLGEAVQVVYEEWERARQSQDVRVLAYMIMPTHFHNIVWAERGESVETFVSRTLGQVSKRLQPGGGFWKERPRVLPLYSRPVLQVKVDYLHSNPIRKSLVANAEDWEHSSYRQLVLGQEPQGFVCDDWDVVPLR